MANDALTLSNRIERSLRVAVGMATAYSLDLAREVGIEAGRPVMLIASRRQVDSERTGGGYLGWTTPEWCARSSQVDDRGRLLLARDHGGPYQRPQDIEQQASPPVAMASALESLRCDIESGVELLHIDTSVGPGGDAETTATALHRAAELVAACTEIAGRARRQVSFEVGFEVQNESISDPEDYARVIVPLLTELRRSCNVSPAFIVAQTGTKVTGRRNTGVLQRRPRSATQGRQLRELAAVISSFGGRLKAHNCDYLGGRAVLRLRSVGAWMNISPEVGTAQTVAVVRSARDLHLGGALDEFCDAVIAAGFWRKWAGGAQQTISDQEKVALGGSYLFSAPVFAELRERLDRALRPDRRCTRRIAIDAAKAVVHRYYG